MMLTEDPAANILTALMGAIKAHVDQKDRAGVPFYHHILRVGTALSPDPELMVLGYLHDMVEDTTTTLEDIEDAFGPVVMAQIDLLTRRTGETYWNYLDRLIRGFTGFAETNAGPLLVKRQDLLDNLLPWRQNFTGAESLARRHEIAIRQVENVLVARGLLNESERYDVLRVRAVTGTAAERVVKPGRDADLVSKSFPRAEFPSHLPVAGIDDDPF